MYSIIIVDDEKLIKQSLQMLIDDYPHFQVKGIANDGKEALELIELHNPEVIITDIRMPVMDGLELMKAVKEKDKNIEIIMLTGYAEFEFARQSLQMGAVDYLLKPVEPDLLYDALDKTRAILESRNDVQSSVPRNDWIWKCKELGTHLAEAVWDLDERHIKQELASIDQVLISNQEQWGSLSTLYADILFYVEQEMINKSSGKLALHTTNYNSGLGTVQLENKEWFEQSLSKIIDAVKLAKDWGKSKLIDNVVAILESRYEEPSLSLSSTAKQFGISASYLSRCFSEEKGISFIQYLTQYRMKKAIAYLLSPDLKTYQVAVKVGYTDYPHFARTFKKHFGISASSYRQKYNSDTRAPTL